MSPPTARTVGPERLLILGYALFVVAVGSRASVQLLGHASRAPTAYALSAVAALVYATGFLAVRRAAQGGTATPARVVAGVELVGVLAVGFATTARPDVFGDDTAWSYFGAGYLFTPLVIPLAVLIWLRLHCTEEAEDPTSGAN